MKHVDFVFFDAGGGHRAAANALKAVIEQRGYPWQVRMVNLQEVLDELDIFRKFTGIRMQDVYNLILKKGWTLGSAQGVVVMHWLIRRYHPGQVRMLKQFWPRHKPDLVVSLIPNFGRALYESLKSTWPQTPLVTVLTDIADYPPHFWMEANQDQYYICGSEKACGQARALGYSDDRVIGVSGMVLHPRFYERPPVDRAAERRKLGLQPDLPTGLILFGGQGSPVMKQLLRRLQSSSTRVQYIAICGKNEALRKQLSSVRWDFPVFVEGFTSEVPYYMRLSDFFIGKPGPGSISEALAMGLPVIVERNAWTLPQERYNADWVREKQVGIVLSNFGEIGAAVQALLAGESLGAFQRAAAALDNQAVFEIPPILERLMQP
ncbi:MAG: galactosyldiacylglycerol synthase [Bryobacterales bacterium]|nr:galactosyldiacylglycerol synthase [Bryobacterales bacterium]